MSRRVRASQKRGGMTATEKSKTLPRLKNLKSLFTDLMSI